MAIPHVSTGPASSSAQNALIDEVNAIRALVQAPDPYVQKSSSDTISNSTSLIDDSEMFLTLSNGLWRINANIGVSGPAAADIKLAWVLSGGAAQATTRQCRGPAIGVTDAATTTMRMSQHNFSTAIAYGCDGSVTSAIEEIGVIEVTGGTGTIRLQFAQNTANAGVTNVTSNTHMYARLVGN